MAYMLRREPCVAEIDNDIVERGFRAGIKNRDAFIRLQCDYGDYAWSAKLASVEDQRYLQFFDTATT